MKKIAIYAHYDADHNIKPFVEYMLSAIREHVDQLVFVTNSKLDDSNKMLAAKYSDLLVECENIGYDFWMWKSALLHMDLSEYDELILLNSSIYGPFFSLSEMFDRMQEENCDYWGVTENFELEHHLQSYFLVFRKKIVLSEHFRMFWESVLPHSNKYQVIRSYEVGLTQWFRQFGYAYAVYCPWNDVLQYYNSVTKKHLLFPLNLSVACAGELLELKVPFLKREVLRDNPVGLDIARIYSIVDRTEYPATLLLQEAKSGIGTTTQPGCPLCGASGRHMRGIQKDIFNMLSLPIWKFRVCNSWRCGAAWLDPMPIKEDIYKAYQEYYTHSNKQRESLYFQPVYGLVKRKLLKRLKGLARMLKLDEKRYEFYLHDLAKEKTGRLLEVGCGSGGRLELLKTLGWDVEGQEVDSAAAESCHNRCGISVHVGDLVSLALSGAAYDVILMSHVLEHVHDQEALLQECMRLLKPGGKLVISTPNISSFGYFVYGEHALFVDAPRHLVVHTTKSLRSMLRKCCFDNVIVESRPYNHEIISIHSRDIRRFGWTELNTPKRIGKELVPVFMQMLALLVWKILPSTGDECYAIAEKKVEN